MKTKFSILLVLTVVALLFEWNCKDKSVDVQIKNPRKFTWDVTVLRYPMSGQTTMYSIWASSPKDVYVCGHNSVAGFGKMYHSDGNGWSPVYLPFGFFDLSQIIGFTANDIWAAGLREFDDPNTPIAIIDSALILHYDGINWTKISSPPKVRGLKSIWGTSSTNLYFGSTNGTVLHLEDAKWRLDTTYLGLSVHRIGGDQTRIFAFGNTARGRSDDSVMCFTKTTGGWNLVDMQLRDHFFLNPRFGLFGICTPATGQYYSTSFGIFQWNGTQWQKVLKTEATIYGVTGLGDSNLIAVGEDAQGPLIYHWDGTNWANVNLPNGLLSKSTGITSVWTNGVEAFAVANDGSQSYVIHGK